MTWNTTLYGNTGIMSCLWHGTQRYMATLGSWAVHDMKHNVIWQHWQHELSMTWNTTLYDNTGIMSCLWHGTQHHMTTLGSWAVHDMEHNVIWQYWNHELSMTWYTTLYGNTGIMSCPWHGIQHYKCISLWASDNMYRSILPSCGLHLEYDLDFH